jgi:phosphoserine phosphatase
MQARLYTASFLPAYPLAKLGVIDWQKWTQGLMISCLTLVRDATPEKMDAVGEWVVGHNLWTKRRPDVIARLQEYKSQGAEIYIASSAVEPLVEPFARRIGAQTIGSPVEYGNGQVRVAGSLAAHDRKIEKVLDRLAVDRVDVALGDSYMDIPLLEHADHPIAVYPEEKLKAIAEERGWEIFGKREK